MATLIPLLIQLLCGGVGGSAAGKALKNIDLSKAASAIIGVIGGVLSGQAVDWLGLLQSVLGEAGSAGDLAGQAGVSGIGGAILVAIIGMIKKAMAGSAAS